MTPSAPGHAAIRQTELGCLALADISGYTSYLAGAELDHAQDVLEDLTNTVVQSLSPPMQLSKLEGDAVFVYLPGSRLDASILLDTLDAAYFAFRRRQEAIDRATQCDCNACTLIPRLDLKFVAHHGEFGRQNVAGGEELSGSDVILVHRLLKNRVAEELGHHGYALYTDAVVAAMGVEPGALRMRRHAEEVEEIGPVEGWLQDLHERWAEERERRRVKVGPNEAASTMSHMVPAPRSVTWSYMTEPELRASWTPGIERIDEATVQGRRGTGTRNHCVHGKDVILEEILDWRPFDYFTIDRKPPMPLLKPVRITYELEDVPDGTRVTEYSIPAPGFGQRLAFSMLTRMMAGTMKEAYDSLGSALAAATGTTPADGSAPGRLSRSKTIDRPPSVVWQFYAVNHARNHPRWDPHMQLEPLTKGPIGVGTRIHRRNTRFGTPIEGVMEVVEFEPERSIGMVIRDETPGGTLEVRGRATLEPIGAERTELTFELELPGAAASVDPSAIEESLTKIKELIEAESDD